MTAAFLQSELTNLVSDSKRKHIDVRTAAEKSLAELKSISVTSETQLAGDLIRKTSFIDPFLLACKSQNVKLASNGAVCLQRLVASTAVPRSRLADLLQAFEEAVPLALEVQLKILQTLPSLLQLYATDLHGEALSRTLSVSADLSSNKLPMVSSTASATFQQLLTAVFAKASARPVDRSQTGQQSDSAQDSEDALAIFIDLCALLSGKQLDFVRLEKLPPALVLEAVESLLSTYGNFILGDQDARKACAESLVPGLLTLIESSVSFPIVARALRITFILTTQHLLQVKSSMADLLTVVLKVADRSSSHKWKRVLGLEFCRGVCSDFEALRRSFAVYDMAEGEMNFVSDIMASLVRIASEDPSLIGLGRQSTIPAATVADGNGEIARTVELPAAVGSVGQAELSSVGLSAQRSTIQTPCLDQYDKSGPPEIPDTYIFTLVLGSISAFSDGLSKLIMPLSVPNRKASILPADDQDDDNETQPQRKESLRNAQDTQKYQQLINPLTRKDINRLSSVQECARMIESCWPAILATCSTFLNAALDSYYYHMLIRTVQKLTQVSGVLELNTPRDALLTTLAKVSVPANVSGLMNTFYGGKPAYHAEADERDVDDVSVKSPIASTPRQSIDLSSQTLNIRNLLCLRALLNLGIALGPTLSASAWTILWQSLEQVEALMSVSPTNKVAQSGGPAGGNDGASSGMLASETSAVDTARRRMIESTSAYTDAAFQIVCRSLFEMIEDVIPPSFQRRDSIPVASGSLRPKTLAHKSTRSVSGSWTKATTLEVEVQFVLKSIGRLASVNLHRFKQESTGPVSWDLVVQTLSLLQSNQRLQTHLRLQCANIIDAIVVESAVTPSDQDTEACDVMEADHTELVVEKYCIPALERQISDTQYHASALQKSSEVEAQTVLLVLQALHNVVSTSGDDLRTGWNQVFAILRSVTSHRVLNFDLATVDIPVSQAEIIAKLYTAAFKVTHLISSDFLSSLNDHTLAELLALFATFGSQRIDLNMSLTTTALYWNISALISEREDLLSPFPETLDSAEVNRAESTSDRGSNLWHLTILGLQSHCKDSRSDTRNAAVRMLAKIIETAMAQMSSKTLNSYYSLVSLPLVSYYSKQDLTTDISWKDSALQMLQDIVDEIQSNSTLVMMDNSFRDFWIRLIASSGHLLSTQDVNVIAATYKALADLVHALCGATTSERFITDKQLLENSWKLWLSQDPTSMDLEGPNHHAYASHAHFLIEMTIWNLEILSTFEQSSQRICEIVNRLVYGSVHDVYTIDVNKVSVEQEQTLRILDVLRNLLVNDSNAHILHLLSLISGLVSRAFSATSGDQSTKPAKGTRQPTGIAFTTTCIEQLRELLRLRVASNASFSNCPFREIIGTSTALINTKYSSLPVNSQVPLWRQATLLAAECITIIQNHWKPRSELDETEAVTFAINKLLSAVLEVPHLDDKAQDARPPPETILADEEFDIAQLEIIHTAAHNTFLSAAEIIPHSSSKQYILILFNHSFVAHPWYNDLPSNLTDDPLQNFTKIRPGSIRAPILFIRQKLCLKALLCLFTLVAAPAASEASSGTALTTNTLSTLAAPYILLRLAHTLRSFLADQPLRYLQHPHKALQHELHVVLRAFLDLRVSDQSFLPTVTKLNLEVSTVANDGKTHLRILTGLVTKFEELWRELPRLRKGLAWQDYEDGRGMEECLVKWREVLNQGTTVRFE